MTSSSSNTTRIAKNTLLLYFRMLLTMGVTLYTSRVVLDVLGVEDYGIYNVVGGIVSMLSFLTSAMSNAAQRFFSYEIGRENNGKVNQIFCLCIIAHFIIAVFVVVVMEFAGVWFVQNKMTIPVGRMEAANWVLQSTIFATFFSIMQVPYNALIIAKERMGVYAYVSIIECILRLIIVYVLVIWSFDKLKLYTLLQLSVTLIVISIYKIYCKKQFEETTFHFIWDKKTLKEITSFAGWNMLGEIAWTFTGQGVNIILNLFFGPAVNAARAIADQVHGAVSKFVSNFQTAINPQIVKTYAANQWNETKKLVFRGTRFSYYLLLLLSLPLMTETDFILHLWLVDVPEYAEPLCRMALIVSLIAITTTYLAQVAKAYGKIRNYQIVVSAILFLNFPLSYVVLRMGYSPVSTMYVAALVQMALIAVRLFLTRKMITISYNDFFHEILKPLIIVSVVAVIIPIIITCYMPNGWLRFIINVTISTVCVCFATYGLGMQKEERIYIKKIPTKILEKFHKK